MRCLPIMLLVLLALPAALPTGLAMEAPAMDGDGAAPPPIARPPVDSDGADAALDEANGEFSVSCRGAFYTICSFAIAVAYNACYDVPFAGEVCVHARAGVAGGFSSLSVDGGGATGLINGASVACSWEGSTSAGCGTVAIDLGFGCAESTVEAFGHVDVRSASLLAPPAVAHAGDCSALATRASAPDEPAACADAERQLSERLAAFVEQLRVRSPDAAAAVEASVAEALAAAAWPRASS